METENKTNEGTEATAEITMTQADYDKAIQSAAQSSADKVRTEYSKKLKDLQAKIPPEKTPAELEFEKRIAAIETREKEATEREKLLGIQAALSEKGLDKGLADYLKSDADTEKFVAAVEAVVEKARASEGFVPKKHNPNPGITKEQWKKMDYSEKMKIFEEHPDLAESLSKR